MWQTTKEVQLALHKSQSFLRRYQKLEITQLKAITNQNSAEMSYETRVGD